MIGQVEMVKINGEWSLMLEVGAVYAKTGECFYKALLVNKDGVTVRPAPFFLATRYNARKWGKFAAAQ